MWGVLRPSFLHYSELDEVDGVMAIGPHVVNGALQSITAGQTRNRPRRIGFVMGDNVVAPLPPVMIDRTPRGDSKFAFALSLPLVARYGNIDSSTLPELHSTPSTPHILPTPHGCTESSLSLRLRFTLASSSVSFLSVFSNVFRDSCSSFTTSWFAIVNVSSQLNVWSCSPLYCKRWQQSHHSLIFAIINCSKFPICSGI